MMRIEIATERSARAALPGLIDIVVDSVDNGGSIGWLPPMRTDAAASYWEERLAALARGDCVLLLAWVDDALAGTAQLNLAQRENGSHRAEVQKVLVHTRFRRRGIARQLMHHLEDCARQHERSLLFLDTREGDASEYLYQQLGYQRVGAIPRYVNSGGGRFDATILYAKILDEPG